MAPQKTGCHVFVTERTAYSNDLNSLFDEIDMKQPSRLPRSTCSQAANALDQKISSTRSKPNHATADWKILFDQFGNSTSLSDGPQPVPRSVLPPEDSPDDRREPSCEESSSRATLDVLLPDPTDQNYPTRSPRQRGTSPDKSARLYRVRG